MPDHIVETVTEVLLVEGDGQIDVLEATVTETLVETQTATELLETTVTEILIEQVPTGDILIEEIEVVELIEEGIQGPPGPPGEGASGSGTPLWWILAAETINVPPRGQYAIHGEFRNEGELRLGANAELRVTA